MSTKSKAKRITYEHRTTARSAAVRYALGVLLVCLGIIWILSMTVSSASRVLLEMNSYLRGFAGFLCPPLPIFLIWAGSALIVSCYHKVCFRTLCLAFFLYIDVLAIITLLKRGPESLMAYIRSRNIDNGYSGSSLSAYLDFVFHEGHRMVMNAGGVLGMLLAWPAWQLFDHIGGAVLLIAVGVFIVFGLCRVSPARLIRSASDMFERRRQNRNSNYQAEDIQPEQPAPSPVPVNDRQPWDSRYNPYPNTEIPLSGPVSPSTPQSFEREPVYPQTEPAPEPDYMDMFRRPESDRSNAANQDDRLNNNNNGPTFMQPNGSNAYKPVNTNDDLYAERFVLHPDGAYDADDYERPSGPDRNIPKSSDETPPSDTYHTIRESSDNDRRLQRDAEKKHNNINQNDRDSGPVKAPETKESEPVRTEKKEETPQSFLPSEDLSPDPIPESDALEEDDSSMADWQKQLQNIKNRINQTRDDRRKVNDPVNTSINNSPGFSTRPEPVHTNSAVDFDLKHVPIGVKPTPSAFPASADKSDKSNIGLDGREKTKRTDTYNSLPANSPYTPPPINLLSLPKATNPEDTSSEDIRRAQQIEKTLSTFNIQTQVRQITHGPAITRFALQIAEGIKVKQVTGVLDNIALDMGSDRLRVEAPIPGTSYIGIEVPNSKVSMVSFREVLDSPEMRAAQSPLTVALGKDIAGKPILGDLSKMPHLLIAGATGSGKSVCINSIICSLLYRTSPEEVRLIMVDPKQVELQVYNGIPHLLIPVVCDPKKAASALNWVVNEMLERYAKMGAIKVRTLDGYNAKQTDKAKRLPHIVVIIDEMADLMEVCRKDVEDSIRRLAALARAAGIYMVLATQRPSVDVITGVIKNNIPSRIAFTVSSGVDSRTIIDINGAEKLMGKGDMLYLPIGASKPLRVQGCFVSDEEVARVTENINARYHADYNSAIQDQLDAPSDDQQDEELEPGEKVSDDEFGSLLHEAIRMAVQDGQTSISMLQRRLRVGYGRAGRLVDEMTKRGIVSESEGSKPRKTLLTREQYQQMMNESPDGIP